MEKYVKPEMEVVEFETEDVILASGCPTDGSGGFEGENHCFVGTSD